VKEVGKRCGADLVGIASMDRFEGAPKQMDPRYINPDAKALIVIATRIPRGTLRGIEEGTYFLSYSSMGYGGINSVYNPMILWQLVRYIENEGYEATPIPNDYYNWPAIDYHSGVIKENWSRPVSPEKPAPDVFIHFRIAAFCAGLGEIGYSKVFLTPEFGPRQRFACILTDAPLQPDPIYEGPKICDRCMLCVKECSGKAISSKEVVKIKVAGRQIEWGKLDVIKCSNAYTGAVKETNPFLPEDLPDKFEEWSKYYVDANPHKNEFVKWYGGIGGHNPGLEGGRGCLRACMIHLEQEGKLKNKFEEPFRKRKPWKLK